MVTLYGSGAIDIQDGHTRYKSENGKITVPTTKVGMLIAMGWSTMKPADPEPENGGAGEAGGLLNLEGSSSTIVEDAPALEDIGRTGPLDALDQLDETVADLPIDPPADPVVADTTEEDRIKIAELLGVPVSEVHTLDIGPEEAKELLETHRRAVEEKAAVDGAGDNKNGLEKTDDLKKVDESPDVGAEG